MKNINDYRTNDGRVGIYCASQEEWDKVCDLLDAGPDHGIRKGYLEHGHYDTIGCYNNSFGWSSKSTYKEVYPASDFVEIKMDFILY